MQEICSLKTSGGKSHKIGMPWLDLALDLCKYGQRQGSKYFPNIFSYFCRMHCNIGWKYFWKPDIIKKDKINKAHSRFQHVCHSKKITADVREIFWCLAKDLIRLDVNKRRQWQKHNINLLLECSNETNENLIRK